MGDAMVEGWGDPAYVRPRSKTACGTTETRKFNFNFFNIYWEKMGELLMWLYVVLVDVDDDADVIVYSLNDYCYISSLFHL